MNRTPYLNLLTSFFVILCLGACSEQPGSVSEYREAQVSGLRLFCEGRNACLDWLNEQAINCEHHLQQFDQDDLTDQESIKVTMDFTGCLMAGADERFLARLNHLIPIKETNTIRFGPDLSDPGVLQVSLESGVIRVSGQPVKEAQLVEYLKTHQLVEQHHKVALLMNKDDMPDVGLMISVMDKLKAAGLEQISMVPQ